MLAVTRERAIQKNDLTEGGRRESQKPVMHEHRIRTAVAYRQIPKSSVHDQRAAGDIVLHQQPLKLYGGRIPALMTEEAA